MTVNVENCKNYGIQAGKDAAKEGCDLAQVRFRDCQECPVQRVKLCTLCLPEAAATPHRMLLLNVA